MLGEDVQDEGGAVDDLDADDVLQGAALGGGELAVDDDRVGSGGGHDVGQLVSLAAAQVGGGIGVVAPLDEGVQDLAAGGLGQSGQLAQRGSGVLGVMRLRAAGTRCAARGGGRPGQLQADQDHLLQTDLAVLDLADVLQFGGQPGHAAAGGAGLAFEGPVVGSLSITGLLLVLGGGGGQGGSGAGEDPGDDVMDVGVVGGGRSVGVVLGHKKSFVVCLRPLGGARWFFRERRLPPVQRIRRIHMGAMLLPTGL